MDQAVIEALSLAVAVVIGAGGILHKVGMLRLGKDEGKCADSDCQKMIRKHDQRLSDGDKSFTEMNGKLDAMAEEQAKQSKLLRKINVNFAYVKVQLRKMGIEGELPGVEDDLQEG